MGRGDSLEFWGFGGSEGWKGGALWCVYIRGGMAMGYRGMSSLVLFLVNVDADVL